MGLKADGEYDHVKGLIHQDPVFPGITEHQIAGSRFFPDRRDHGPLVADTIFVFCAVDIFIEVFAKEMLSNGESKEAIEKLKNMLRKILKKVNSSDGKETFNLTFSIASKKIFEKGINLNNIIEKVLEMDMDFYTGGPIYDSYQRPFILPKIKKDTKKDFKMPDLNDILKSG